MTDASEKYSKHSDEDLEAVLPRHELVTKDSSHSTPQPQQGLEEQVQRLLGENDPSCFLVTVQPGDPDFAMDWPTRYKIQLTIFYGLTAFGTQLNSSIMAPVVAQIMDKFGVGRTVATLPTSLFVLGNSFGPMLFAPFSEVYGRKIGVLLPFFISIVFTVATGASTRIESVLITRFFAGLFASGPIVSSGGVLADIWQPAVRGTSLVLYAMFVVFGPTLGTIVGTVIDVKAAWQWTCWVSALTMGVILVVDVFIISESYGPVLALKKAKAKRRETGNWLYHAKHEEWEFSLNEFCTVHLVRPFAMFGTPIVFFIALYTSFVFGVYYLFLTSISTLFREVHNWKEIPSGLSFIALFVGVVIARLFNLWGGRRYAYMVRKNGGVSLPEERLYVTMYTCWLLPAGLFVFAWTQRESVHWIAPLIGMAMFSCGFFVIFQSCLNYIVDFYTRYAASAIAANTFLRSVFGAAFPLFGYILFDNLGAGGAVRCWRSLRRP